MHAYEIYDASEGALRGELARLEAALPGAPREATLECVPPGCTL